ncbi:MAG: hypothetical protein PHP92_05525 [Candidatus Nanoarchaeia archaeon]|nr:hypothetical protein [Candidatus Nanoarchaeia archaeon]
MATEPIERFYEIPIFNGKIDEALDDAEYFLDLMYENTQSGCPVGEDRPNQGHAGGSLKDSWFGEIMTVGGNEIIVRYGYEEVYAEYVDKMTGWFDAGESDAISNFKGHIEEKIDAGIYGDEDILREQEAEFDFDLDLF